MTLLAATVLDARPSAETASPGVTFRLRLEEFSSEGLVHALALHVQTRIEPRGRRYSSDEQHRLYELFGDPSQWDRTLRGVVWAHSALVVPTFEKRIDVDLPVACTYDLEVAAAKYLHAIRGGDVPLAFLFSGTLFRAIDGRFRVEPISWDLEAAYRMPTDVWQAAMDRFFPGGGWLRVERSTIDRLQTFRGRHALLGWDTAIDALLERAETEQPA
jgi:hypothetical protein